MPQIKQVVKKYNITGAGIHKKHLFERSRSYISYFRSNIVISSDDHQELNYPW